jgi:hypothetical protein
LASFLSSNGMADVAWTAAVEIPDDPEFPTLRLPASRLRYSTARSYPVAFEPRLAADRPLLFVEIGSFDSAAHAASSPGWAIPAAYKPRDEHAHLIQVLGFDEGWEDAEHECIFACDAGFAAFWRAASERGRFGLTADGADALYPVRLDARLLEPIASFLAAASAAAKRTPAAKKAAAPKRGATGKGRR